MNPEIPLKSSDPDTQIQPTCTDSADAETKEIVTSDIVPSSYKGEVKPIVVNIRRGLPKATGVYVKGDVHGTDVIFTIDTGASVSLLSKKIYDAVR